MKSFTSAARLRDNKNKKVINPSSFPETTYSLWKYWFSHYPAVGPYSNTVKLGNHHSNPPTENRHRSEKLFEHLHSRPQKKSQTIFITQGRATNHPREDTIIWDSKHLHFDQTPLPWLGAMSRFSLRTGYSLAQPLFFWWAQYRSALWTGILQLQRVLCPARQFWISTKVERKNRLLQNPRIYASFPQLPSFVHYHLSLSLNFNNHSPSPRTESIYFTHVLYIKICFQKVELIHSEWHNFFKDFHIPRRFAL